MSETELFRACGVNLSAEKKGIAAVAEDEQPLVTLHRPRGICVKASQPNLNVVAVLQEPECVRRLASAGEARVSTTVAAKAVRTAGAERNGDARGGVQHCGEVGTRGSIPRRTVTGPTPAHNNLSGGVDATGHAGTSITTAGTSPLRKLGEPAIASGAATAQSFNNVHSPQFVSHMDAFFRSDARPEREAWRAKRFNLGF